MEVPTRSLTTVAPRGGGVVRDHERERQQDRPLGPGQVARGIRGRRDAGGHACVRGAQGRHYAHAQASQRRKGARLRRGAPAEPRGGHTERPAQGGRRAQAAEGEGIERGEARGRRRRRHHDGVRTVDGTSRDSGRYERAGRRRGHHAGRRAARRLAGCTRRRYDGSRPPGNRTGITRRRRRRGIRDRRGKRIFADATASLVHPRDAPRLPRRSRRPVPRRGARGHAPPGRQRGPRHRRGGRRGGQNRGRIRGRRARSSRGVVRGAEGIERGPAADVGLGQLRGDRDRDEGWGGDREPATEQARGHEGFIFGFIGLPRRGRIRLP